MKNRGKQNEWLDEIGRALLEASKVGDDEIENIVASANLFQSVKARIEEQRPVHKFRIMGVIQIWKRQLAAAACGLIVAFVAVEISLNQYSKKTPPVVKAPIHNAHDRIVSTDTRDVAIQHEETEHFEPRNAPVVQKAVYKTRSRMVDRPVAEPEEVTEFYPLAGASAEGNNDGGQLVRIELPRSALIAMGVDPPAENDKPKVKTDVLIGSDGVMKAVRFVK